MGQYQDGFKRCQDDAEDMTLDSCTRKETQYLHSMTNSENALVNAM